MRDRLIASNDPTATDPMAPITITATLPAGVWSDMLAYLAAQADAAPIPGHGMAATLHEVLTGGVAAARMRPLAVA